MATVPPPYSPREAARAQRLYRRSLRRPSMVGPLVLIAVGVVALLVETDKLDLFHLWEWYIRWWPLLLIAIGLLSLGEWWLDQQYASQYATGGYRRSHGGLVSLIVSLALLGYVVHSSRRGLHRWGVFGDDQEEDTFFGQLLGQEHDRDRNLNQALPAGAVIDIQAPHGDVTLSLSGDDQIHVQAHEVVYASNRRAAERGLDALAPELTVHGQSVTLRTPEENDGRVDLIIEIPRGSVPSVTAGHGDVTLDGLAGDAVVAATHGDVKIDNQTGSVRVHMSKGDFSAHAVHGDVTLEGHMEDVTLSEIEGRVALSGDFFGDISLAHISGPVHLHSSRTDVEVVNLPGNFSIDSDDLQLNNAPGPARIATSAKDVNCTAISGDLRVEDSDADISVGVVAPLGEVQVHNKNGAIHLTVPRGAGFQLQATTRDGDLDSKLDLPVTDSGDGHSVAGQVGAGGPKIDLLADHGDIEITRVDAGLALPAPPSPPAPPLPPGSKPLRRLRPSIVQPDAPPVVQQ